ncbi:Plasmodium yoelii subtelomeric region (PYST-C1), putative [Plasmodium chabaudi adami]|uniref:Plasmodium yoelii subtelomeric region (PYST-C1), putative n=1 Tax=Plasmodium chabaudi adami TaxID=5826 RepID=A0A1D3L6Q0_PLACE|nr:Plasmodium yoelii subtelomeric region (PYST-C1), putative [Plasmodium chabaudi adami]
MNKRIYSLVCIVLYAILAISIHCSEQKASGIRGFFRSIKKPHKSKGKNGIEYKCETQLNNNNNNSPKNEDKKGTQDDDTEYEVVCCCLYAPKD